MDDILKKTSKNVQKNNFLTNMKYSGAGMTIIAIFNHNIY